MSIDIRELVIATSKKSIQKELAKEGAEVTSIDRAIVVIGDKEYVELSIKYNTVSSSEDCSYKAHKALFVYYGANGAFYYVTKNNKLVPARTQGVILRRARRQANKDTSINR